MLNQVPVVRLEAGIWVSVGSIVLTLLLVSFQSLVIRKTNSVAIKADMLHYRSDSAAQQRRAAGTGAGGQGWYWADGLFAILIGLFLVGRRILATNRCRPCSIVSCQRRNKRE